MGVEIFGGGGDSGLRRVPCGKAGTAGDYLLRRVGLVVVVAALNGSTELPSLVSGSRRLLDWPAGFTPDREFPFAYDIAGGVFRRAVASFAGLDLYGSPPAGMVYFQTSFFTSAQWPGVLPGVAA